MEILQSEQLVVKSNRLTEARYEFNIWETRVFTKMVTMINKEDDRFKKYKIEISELIEFFGGKSNNDYERIREVPESLMQKIISIPYIAEDGEERLFMTPLIVCATKPKNKSGKKVTSYIELTFHPDLKDHLLALKEKFLKYDIKNVLSISSAHSVRFYELLKQYEKIGYRTFEVEELKNILGIADKYPLYANFKQRILKQAQKDVKQFTDIEFTFEELKRSKRIYALKFFIHKNKTSSKGVKKTSKASKTSKSQKGLHLSLVVREGEDSQVIQALVEVGVSFKKALALVAESGESAVMNELRYAKKELEVTSNVKNSAGFIIRMIEQQSYAKAQAVKQAKKLEEKKRQAKIEQKKKQIEKLRLEYVEKRNLAVNKFLKGMTKKEITSLIDSIASSFTKKAIKKAIDNKNKEEEYDLKYSVIAKEMEQKELYDFDFYLAMVYKSKIVRDGGGESLKRL